MMITALLVFGCTGKIDDGATDSDGDGLTDAEEAKLGSDPEKADTDGDGFDDDVEVLAGTDPNNPAEFPGSSSLNVPALSAPGIALLCGVIAMLGVGIGLRRRVA